MTIPEPVSQPTGDIELGEAVLQDKPYTTPLSALTLISGPNSITRQRHDSNINAWLWLLYVVNTCQDRCKPARWSDSKPLVFPEGNYRRE